MSEFNDKKNDPHLKRESSQYEHPVPSREYILSHMKACGCPTSYKQLVEAFNLTEPEEQEGLRRRLIAMSRDGQIMGNRKGSYGLVDQLEITASSATASAPPMVVRMFFYRHVRFAVSLQMMLFWFVFWCNLRGVEKVSL